MLNNKTELEKAFAKHKKSLDEKRKEQEQDEDEFKKMIAERAKRLEKVKLTNQQKMAFMFLISTNKPFQLTSNENITSLLIPSHESGFHERAIAITF